MGKADMVAHLRKCLPASAGGSRGAPTNVVLIRAQANGAPIFWLDIAAKPEAKLKDLDRLLRQVWLECCGHLSEFYGGAHRKVSMSTTIHAVVSSIGSHLGYVYDFGSSTELLIGFSDSVKARTDKPVQVVARNEPPVWPCDVCAKPATAVCSQCGYEGKGFCCSEHAASHDCGDEMLLPVVNSPRMGVCGYTGEA